MEAGYGKKGNEAAGTKGAGCADAEYAEEIGQGETTAGEAEIHAERQGKG